MSEEEVRSAGVPARVVRGKVKQAEAAELARG
jgi:hypothetical protein